MAKAHYESIVQFEPPKGTEEAVKATITNLGYEVRQAFGAFMGMKAGGNAEQLFHDLLGVIAAVKLHHNIGPVGWTLDFYETEED